MNPLALLQVPWWSSHRSMRWFSMVVFMMCSIGAIAVGALVAKPERWVGAITVYGFGLLYLWAFFLSTCLLLAIDTRQLRVPAVQWHIVLSLLLYGALTIGLPAGVMAMFDLPAWNAVVALALFGVCGLMFALMPRFMAIFIGLMPSLLTALWRRLDLPGMTDPRFAHWGLFVVLIVLAMLILRWRQLLLVGPNVSMGWSSPLVIQFRNGSWGQWNNIGDNRMLRQRPDWLRPVVDFDHVGPGNPRKALRIALGGWYLPQTVRSYLKQLVLLLCIVLLPMIGSILLTRSGHVDSHAGEIAKGALLGAFGSLTVIAGPMICLLTMVWISKRWQRANAELSLLALLPGLGSPARAKQSLLRVGLGLPLLMHALLALLIVVAMLWWQNHALLMSFMLLTQLGAATITTAIVLNLFGGRALTTPAISLMLTAVLVLTALSLFLPSMAQGNHPISWAVSLLPPLAIAWLLLAATMFWLGRRGWRDLMQQPHPFLVH